MKIPPSEVVLNGILKTMLGILSLPYAILLCVMWGVIFLGYVFFGPFYFLGEMVLKDIKKQRSRLINKFK